MDEAGKGRDIEFSREMGITHVDFFRRLPAAINFTSHQVSGSATEFTVGGGSLHISLGPELRRKIALLSLPKTMVYFRFRKVSQAEVDEFMRRFELYYRRGGG